MTTKKRCFVIQGFGTKVDPGTGRPLNLDDSYAIIKEAVQDAGLVSVRADEIMHSGSIDVEMWEQVLNADLVIADVSTSNWNAAYELGVRHALRPSATIVVAENQFKLAFDISHIAICRYEHLGPELGRKEATRFKETLQSLVEQVMSQDSKDDSPVYISLPGLAAPEHAAEPTAKAAADGPYAEVAATQQDTEAWGRLVEKAMEAKSASDWITAKTLLQTAHEIVGGEDYITQQLALATYKSESPGPVEAFQEAGRVLDSLDPETSHDTETIGLNGAIHKGMWHHTQEREHLDRAIGSYRRGFLLKNDTYNGINYAFLLNVRSGLSEAAEAIADFVEAQRVRSEVASIAEAQLDNPVNADDAYWTRATLWEAFTGIGDDEAAAKWEDEARSITLDRLDGPRPPEDWMLESTETQVAATRDLLKKSPLDLLGGGPSGEQPG